LFFPAEAVGHHHGHSIISKKAKDAGNHPILISCVRPTSYWDVVGTHLPIALVTGIPLLLSILVPLDLIPYPGCTFLKLTGLPCPFCGLTRSFWAISSGDWTYAGFNYPLSFLVYFIIALTFLWNITGLVMGVRISVGRPIRHFLKERRYWIIVSLSLLIAVNWAYRLMLGLK
jgi:hypothetical protein